MAEQLKKSRRKRGVILSVQGWQRLQAVQSQLAEKANNKVPYTLEELSELTELSLSTLARVRDRKIPVDRRTLEEYFTAFGITLTPEDYLKPGLQPVEPQPQSPELLTDEVEGIEIDDLDLPEGPVGLGSKFYLERQAVEAQCYKTLIKPGALIRIKAPRLMGKTSLKVRILQTALDHGHVAISLDLGLADRRLFNNLDAFLQWFCASVSVELGLPNRLSEYWDDIFGSKTSCNMYFEKYLLPHLNQPLALALEEVDRIFTYPELADDFFSLLRAWHEAAKQNPVWSQLKLILVYSTEVYIPLNINQSPFNVGLSVDLPEFLPEQVNELALRHNLDWSLMKTHQLMNMVGGHPFLIRVALFFLAQQDCSLDDFLTIAPTESGPYGSHLRRYLQQLEQQPDLLKILLLILESPEPVQLKPSEVFKLNSMGLVILNGNTVVSRCELYRRYFCDRAPLLNRQLGEINIEIDQKEREKDVSRLTDSLDFQNAQQESTNLDEFWR
ncbi:MAG: AAA-like domain-containing protein [Cyanobacteria bacterium P01_F01_bin.150]